MIYQLLRNDVYSRDLTRKLSFFFMKLTLKIIFLKEMR